MGDPDFDMKHLKKAKEHTGRNIVSITIKLRSIVRIYEVITFLFCLEIDLVSHPALGGGGGVR